MKDKNIGHSILITTALPKDFNKAKNGYVGRHGNRIIIIPMDYSIIHAVVSLIRGNLINMYKTKKDTILDEIISIEKMTSIEYPKVYDFTIPATKPYTTTLIAKANKETTVT